MAIKLKNLLQQTEASNQEPIKMSVSQYRELIDKLTKAGGGTIDLKSSGKVFEDFVKQTQKREELLKDATEEQKKIFGELENTLQKLQGATHADSVALRRSIEQLSQRLQQTPKTESREKISRMMPGAPRVQPASPIGQAAAVGPQAVPGKGNVTNTRNQTNTTNNTNNTNNYFRPQAGLVAPISPTAYPLYEDSGGVGSVPNEEFAPIVEDLVQGGGNGGFDLPTVIQDNKNKKGKKGKPTAVGGGDEGKAKKTRAKPKGWKGFRPQNARGQFVSKTPMNVIKHGLRVMPKPGVLTAAGGVLSAADTYMETGDATSAAISGGSTMAGMAIGGTLGSALGPIGTAVGATLGAEYLSPLIEGGINAFRTPALSKDTWSDIEQQRIQNEKLKQATPAPAPTLMQNAQQSLPTPQNPLSILGTRGDTRPNESALEQYMRRTSIF